MTREEEIRKNAKEYSEYKLSKISAENGFIDGAKWADKHSEYIWIDTEADLPYYHRELITEDGVTTLPVPIIDHDGFLRLSNMVKCGTTWVWEEGVNPQYWLNIPKFPLKPKEISMTKEEQKQKAIALVEAYFNGTNILMKDPYAGIKDWTTIHNPSIWSYLGKFCENVDKYKIV